ncbi:MAG: DUF952 domain-containing protein [Polyangia bacterium]
MTNRWLYHALVRGTDADPYAPSSLVTEGFIHCSFAPTLRDSIALHYAGRDDIDVWQLDPRLLDTGIDVADTPRGPMPHVLGVIPRAAIRQRWTLAELPELPDAI